MKAKTIRAHLALTALPALVAMAIAGSAGAQDYKWPDNIPPEAKAMMEPMPLSPRGQPVVGFPDGPDASSPDSITFTPEELQKLKTGALITAAAEIGCIAAGGGVETREAVRRYARSLGTAFQIQDDILDVVGDEHMLGKPIGSDAESEKTTFVTLKGVEACRTLVAQKTEQAKDALRKTTSDSGFLCWLADRLVAREA